MIDAYTILLLRSAGWSTLAIVSFVGYCLFYFSGYPNGISRLFGLCLLALSMLAVMVTSTGLVIIFGNTSTQAQLDFFYWYWTREAVALWLLNAIIAILGIYLLRHKDD